MNWCVLTLGKKNPNTCCTDTFVPLVVVTQQKATPSLRHDPARRNLVPDADIEETI